MSGGVGLALAATCVELGRRQRHAGRTAALLGVAVGIIYAASAAVLKGVTDIIARHRADVLISWQPYVLVVLDNGGLLLNQLAFQAGPIVASLPTTATVDPCRASSSASWSTTNTFGRPWRRNRPRHVATPSRGHSYAAGPRRPGAQRSDLREPV